MTAVPRLVLDTNVVLSALVFTKGRLAPLRDAWQKARCVPLVSAATAGELMRVLAYAKFKMTNREQDDFLADYLPFCTTVRMPEKAPRTPECRDPFDLPFLQLAIVGKADYLVTGDRDLLSLANRFSHAIIAPADFFELVQTR